MASVIFIGLEQATASQIRKVLPADRHCIEYKDAITSTRDLPGADIVFVGGGHNQSLSFLRQVKTAVPHVPCVVATRMPETNEWLDSLEAGATDYCAAPFDSGQLLRLLNAVCPARTGAATA
jgi:DNA-binding response OmpR family regulator